MNLSKNNETTVDEEKRKLAEQFLAALQKRDWKFFRSLLTDDVVWSLPGHSVISGEARGAKAVVGRAQLIVSYDVKFQLKHILIGQYGAALSLHNTARRDDLTLDEHLATVFSIRDGKIAAINTHLSDIESVNAFFISV